ncbi:hypothetical protein BATDEDRAFT_24981 [Batrachochytrium dendrobatidis JAM81]|uniref:Uncharacterized protein n=1 Tax=Batrachochytrium dendrobatidis (strain JAM81 / FGSC 10211) TaxID=684364 RepID=F4P351_BATDJ|nr:uncharacterized protein BATDEDRAFT_24981 [Batrachochytrium dendrobatidis JAM81]EGF80169.1 hypothetical protein BATDEDRAFT_24981 [Batrachochytrium dendrobatidis JAM81]|eukprot:XP_006678978.1 hypothetical protein BATDEDRAFT_24981 [Batrachochytrium dendrobatidis JAM81]
MVAERSLTSLRLPFLSMPSTPLPMPSSWYFMRFFQILVMVSCRIESLKFEAIKDCAFLRFQVCGIQGNLFDGLNIWDSQSTNKPRCFLQFLSLLKTHTEQTLHVFDEYFISLEPDLLDAFQSLQSEMCLKHELRDGMIRLCESFSVQSQVYDILRNADPNPDVLFQEYLDCLDLGSINGHHGNIIQNIWEWFDRKLSPRDVQCLRVVFAEAEVSQEFGIDQDVMAKARHLISNDAIYLGILSTLTQHNTRNIPWSETVGTIQHLVDGHSMGLWESLENLFDEWRGVPLSLLQLLTSHLQMHPFTFEIVGQQGDGDRTEEPDPLAIPPIGDGEYIHQVEEGFNEQDTRDGFVSEGSFGTDSDIDNTGRDSNREYDIDGCVSYVGEDLGQYRDQDISSMYKYRDTDGVAMNEILEESYCWEDPAGR